MILCSILAVLALGPPPAQAAPNRLMQSERAMGFELLFDGRTFNGWKGWRRPSSPNGWGVDDASIAYRPGRESGSVCTVDEFSDFELRIDWKVDPGGNSGIFYRTDESKTPAWATGMEMQVLDNHRHPDGKNPLTSAGSLYGMYAPSVNVTRAAGAWNEARIVAKGAKLEHWLNGVCIVRCEIGSSDWEERFARSKFKELPGFGRTAKGRIVLQDHGNRVWFRNVRVRKL